MSYIYENWTLKNCAPIFTVEEFNNKRWAIKTNIVATSGGYDPIHPGHISSIQDSANYGFVVVIVNGDSFLKAKKGKPFMDLKTRCQIVSSVKNVGCVIPFEIENDQTVCQILKELKPNIFTKGGDRKDISSIPEWNVCQENNIRIVTNVGLDKNWSSSDFLKNWKDS